MLRRWICFAAAFLGSSRYICSWFRFAAITAQLRSIADSSPWVLSYNDVCSVFHWWVSWFICANMIPMTLMLASYFVVVITFFYYGMFGLILTCTVIDITLNVSHYISHYAPFIHYILISTSSPSASCPVAVH